MNVTNCVSSIFADDTVEDDEKERNGMKGERDKTYKIKEKDS